MIESAAVGLLLVLVPEILDTVEGMHQRNFDLLMTLTQVVGGGVIAGVIAWWAVKAGAAAALKHERDLRAEEQRTQSAGVLATTLLEVRKLITQARETLTADTPEPAARFEEARTLMGVVLVTWAPTWRDHLHVLRQTPLQPHLEEITNLVFFGGLVWFFVPYHSGTDMGRIHVQLGRFETFVQEVTMDLARLRRGDPLEGVPHPYSYPDVVAGDTS